MIKFGVHSDTLNLFLKNAIYSLQKILLDNFLRNLYVWSANGNGACMQ